MCYYQLVITDVTGSALLIQARRASLRMRASGAVMLLIAVGKFAFAQDRLPPAPGPVGAIRRDASGQIVPVEPIDSPPRLQRSQRRPAPPPSAPVEQNPAAAPAGQVPSTPPAEAQPPASRPSAVTPLPHAPAAAAVAIVCDDPRLRCVAVRAVMADGRRTYVQLVVSARSGAIRPNQLAAPAPTNGGSSLQVDSTALHADGSVRLATLSAVLVGGSPVSAALTATGPTGALELVRR